MKDEFDEIDSPKVTIDSLISSKKEDTVQITKPTTVQTDDVDSKSISDDSGFTYRESTDTGKTIITIAAEKGCGKTRFALGLPGVICALSFDRKTTSVKATCYDNDPRIHVVDAVEFYTPDSDLVCESAIKTYDFIMWNLDYFKRFKPDWILFDAAGVEAKVAEFAMRHRQGLKAYQGIANLSFWKIRNAILDTMHQKAVSIANKGVVYTTYTQFSEIVVDGTTTTKEKVPKYVADVLMETDIVLMIEKKYDPKNHKTKFYLRCDSSKFDKVIPTGFYEDITDRKIENILALQKRQE